MKVTFPHMGNIYIAMKVLFEELGVDVIVPPDCSKKTLELGTKNSPELACLPLKINIGNFIQGIEVGADTIVMAGGCGPCRFGYYGEVQNETLKDLGLNFKMITLEPPNGDIKEFIGNIKNITGNNGLIKVFKAVNKAIKIAQGLDKLEDLSFFVRPREKIKGKTDLLLKNFKLQVDKLNGFRKILDLINNTREQLNFIDIADDFVPLKIGIVGEIFTVVEPFTNFDICNLLGSLGVEVQKSLSISHWIDEHWIKAIIRRKNSASYVKAAKPYLGTMIGGHARESIGNSVLYANEGYDGVIQIYPFTCMPEIVAQSILPKISKDMNIPILTVIIDELTGEAGYKTRVEAFVDMLLRRREKIAVNEY
jgi:predicted nucleotide-binding protein (sugar kinase/HSP70/actin superfamily)